MVNLGEAKAGPDSFHVISSKLQRNCISLYDDLSYFYGRLEHQR